MLPETCTDKLSLLEMQCLPSAPLVSSDLSSEHLLSLLCSATNRPGLILPVSAGRPASRLCAEAAAGQRLQEQQARPSPSEVALSSALQLWQVSEPASPLFGCGCLMSKVRSSSEGRFLLVAGDAGFLEAAE